MGGELLWCPVPVHPLQNGIAGEDGDESPLDEEDYDAVQGLFGNISQYRLHTSERRGRGGHVVRVPFGTSQSRACLGSSLVNSAV